MDTATPDYAGAEFYELNAKLFPAAFAKIPSDDFYDQVLDKPVNKLCGEIISSGYVKKLMRLHETLRGPRSATDPRLAQSFAEAVRRLVSVNDATSEALAEELLEYAGKSVDRSHPDLQSAASALARKRAVIDENRTYMGLFSVYRSFPSASIHQIARDVMLDLKNRNQYEQAILFFGQARGVFGEDARELTPVAVAALENVRSPEARTQLLTTVWQSVTTELEQNRGPAALQTWRLEYADMLLVLSQWDRARNIYLALHGDTDMPPELRTRAALRLAAISFVRGGTPNANEYLVPLLNEDGIRDELRLALRLLAQPESLRPEALAPALKAARAPLLLSDAEWDLFKGLRLRMEKSDTATAALEAAAKRASFSRSWVDAVASTLLRSSTRGSDELK
jgi:hypothetical protein